MRKRLIGFTAVGAAAVLALTAACSTEDPEAIAEGFEDCEENPDTCNSGDAADGGSMTWIITFAPSAYAGFSNEGGSVATLQATLGMLPFTGQYQPSGEFAWNMDLLAEEPTYSDEGEQPQAVYQIDPEAVWSNGEPITADDFRLTWMMSTSPDEGQCDDCRSRSTTGADQVESIEGSEDGKTVTVTWKPGSPQPEWHGQFSVHGIAGGVYPAWKGEEIGVDIDDPAQLGELFEYFNDTAPDFSGGPYQITEWELEDQVIMEPNPNWYGEEPAHLDRIVKIFNDAEETWVQAYRNGEADAGAIGAQEDVILELQDIEDVRLRVDSSVSWGHLDLNFDNPWLGEHQALRQAIFTAINTQEITERVYGAILPDPDIATSHVHAAGTEFHTDVVTPTGQGTGNIEAARQLLADAGFEGYDSGEAGTLSYEGETLPAFRWRGFETGVVENSLQLQQQALAQIGIEANLEYTTDLGGTLAGGDYDAMQFGWSASPLFTGTIGQFFQTDSGSNFGHYSNPQVDQLIEDEQGARTLEESAQIQDQALQIVVEDAYVLPIWQTPRAIFVRDTFVNVRDNTMGSPRAFYNIGEFGLSPDAA